MSHPRFNHVALSVPASRLGDAGRAEILDFSGEVFGWEEMPTMTEPGQRLVLQAYAYDQFVFIIAEDEPMVSPRMDHFGMAVDSMEEFTSFLDRARAYAGKDDRVDLIDAEVETFGADGVDFLRLHNFYVGFQLPLLVEVQFFEWLEG